MKRPILAAVTIALAAAPATASAATIQVAATNGSQVIAYEAAPGEVNALRMRGTVDGPFDLRMEFFEFSAPLPAGPGCVAGTPTTCGAVDSSFPVAVSLGDRDDVASTNSFTGDLTMDAGSGDDDVLAGGIDADAAGGSGSDTMVLAASNLIEATGGSGRDRIAGGLGAASVSLDGGTGSDLLVPDGFLSNEATGGDGGDDIVAFRGRDVALRGAGGSDVLVASTGTGAITLEGGGDTDIAFSHLGGVTVNAGSGEDIVDVRGSSTTAPDTVSCGSGWDIAWVNGTDTVASDCEFVLKIRAPVFRRVGAAVTAARDLLAHRPDPSA